jgi:hypothetical protein
MDFESLFMPKLKVEAVGNRVRRGAPALGALVAAGVALAGGSASAQVTPGYSGSSTTGTMETEEALRTLGVFGVCYARQNAADAYALIATEPGSRAEAETYRRLFRRDNQSCLGEATELGVPVAFVRGAIAEGLYKRSVALPLNLALAAPTPGAPVRRLSEAARCYTATHRDEVRSLVENTPPGGRRESAALTTIAPGFYQCLPETARGRRFNATQIRYLLAEALLRMPSASAGQR